MPLLCPTGRSSQGPPSKSNLLPLSIEQPRAAGAPPELRSSVLAPSLQSSSPAQRGSSPRSSLFSPSMEQPRAAGAPPEAATSLRPRSSPAAQRELPQKHQPPPSLNRAAAGSPAQRELPQKQPPLSLYQAAPRSGSSPRSSHFSPSMEQPRRAAGAPPEASASSLSQSSSSPAQRELPQKQPPPSLNRAAPRSGSSPQKQPLLSVYGAAPRRGSSPRSSFLPPSISSMEQPRAAGAPPEAASSLYGAAPRSGSSPKSSLFSPSIDLSSSPSQRELPQKQPPPSLNRAATRSGSSPRSSLFSPSIEQPREFTKRAETASSLSQLSSPAQREPGGGSSLPKLLPSSSSGPPSLSHLHLEVLEHSVWVRSTDAHSRVRPSKEGTAFHMHHSS